MRHGAKGSDFYFWCMVKIHYKLNYLIGNGIFLLQNDKHYFTCGILTSNPPSTLKTAKFDHLNLSGPPFSSKVHVSEGNTKCPKKRYEQAYDILKDLESKQLFLGNGRLSKLKIEAIDISHHGNLHTWKERLKAKNTLGGLKFLFFLSNLYSIVRASRIKILGYPDIAY